MPEYDSNYRGICFNKCFSDNLSYMNIERFVIKVNEQGASRKLSAQKPNPLEVSKTQTRITQTLLLSQKLRPDEFTQISVCLRLLQEFLSTVH